MDEATEKQIVTEQMDQLVRLGVLSNNDEHYWVSERYVGMLKHFILRDMQESNSTFEEAFEKGKQLVLLSFVEPVRLNDATSMMAILNTFLSDSEVQRLKKFLVK